MIWMFFCMLGAMIYRCKRFLGPFSALLLAACASHAPAPVTDLTAGSQASQAAATKVEPAGIRLVERGDSLYAIALANNVDWRDLARWNDISAPYTIRPGMRLALDGPVAPPQPEEPSRSNGAPVAVFEPLPDPADPVAASRPEPANDVAPPPASSIGSAPVAGSVEAEPPATPPAPVDPAPEPVVAAGESRQVGGIRWSWPATGALEYRFEAGNPARQGINIGGERGAPVRAAAAGEVVYSGNGLVGYGELVIIKHSGRFLSAYGHNSARLAKEGDHVQRGETIAKMGSSGASHVALHFEIRADGKPVDPLAFLPRKN